MESVITGLAFLTVLAGSTLLFMRNAPQGLWSSLAASLTFFLFFIGILLIGLRSSRNNARFGPYPPGMSWGIVSFRQAALFVLVIGAGIGTTAWLKSLGL